MPDRHTAPAPTVTSGTGYANAGSGLIPVVTLDGWFFGAQRPPFAAFEKRAHEAVEVLPRLLGGEADVTFGREHTLPFDVREGVVLLQKCDEVVWLAVQLDLLAGFLGVAADAFVQILPIARRAWRPP